MEKTEYGIIDNHLFNNFSQKEIDSNTSINQSQDSIEINNINNESNRKNASLIKTEFPISEQNIEENDNYDSNFFLTSQEEISENLDTKSINNAFPNDLSKISIEKNLLTTKDLKYFKNEPNIEKHIFSNDSNSSDKIKASNNSLNYLDVLNQNTSKTREKRSRTPTSKSKKSEIVENLKKNTGLNCKVYLEDSYNEINDQLSPVKADQTSLPRRHRNRKRPTKYDLAFKQLEELGDFLQQCEGIDIKKIDANSFAYDIISCPLKYTYETWQQSSTIRLGADGRRLLLRKLRAVNSTNPKIWQDILQKNDFGDVKNIFTVATVPNLLKIAHLMGADVWNFALKCACFTYKCPALSMKENEEISDFEDSYLLTDSISDNSPIKSVSRTPRKNNSYNISNTNLSPNKSPRKRKRTPKKQFESDKDEFKKNSFMINEIQTKTLSHIPEYEYDYLGSLEIKKNDDIINSPVSNNNFSCHTPIRNGDPISYYEPESDFQAKYDSSAKTTKRKRNIISETYTYSDSQYSPLLTSTPSHINTNFINDENRDYFDYLKKIKIANEEYKLELAHEGFLHTLENVFNNREEHSNDDRNILTDLRNKDLISNTIRSSQINSAPLRTDRLLSSDHHFLPTSSPFSIKQKSKSLSSSYSSEMNFQNEKFDDSSVNIPLYEISDSQETNSCSDGVLMADECIFVQFLHCITLLDLTRKIIHSMKGKYTTSLKSCNGKLNDSFNLIKDEEDSRLKFLTESSGNQIESLIKMSNILYKSHNSIPTLSKNGKSYSIKIDKEPSNQNHNFTESRKILDNNNNLNITSNLNETW